MITFEQSRNIKDFRPLIDNMIPDFGPIFLHTVLQWCELADDPYDGRNQFWEVWLIKEDGVVIGICGLYSLQPHKTDNLWLGWLGIIPSHRNKGLGKNVMQHLYKEAKKVNCETIYSYVDVEGKPLTFYKREGFEILGSVEDFLNSNHLSQIDGSDFEDPKDWVICKKL